MPQSKYWNNLNTAWNISWLINLWTGGFWFFKCLNHFSLKKIMFWRCRFIKLNIVCFHSHIQGVGWKRPENVYSAPSASRRGDQADLIFAVAMVTCVIQTCQLICHWLERVVLFNNKSSKVGIGFSLQNCVCQWLSKGHFCQRWKIWIKKLSIINK